MVMMMMMMMQVRESVEGVNASIFAYGQTMMMIMRMMMVLRMMMRMRRRILLIMLLQMLMAIMRVAHPAVVLMYNAGARVCGGRERVDLRVRADGHGQDLHATGHTTGTGGTTAGSPRGLRYGESKFDKPRAIHLGMRSLIVHRWRTSYRGPYICVCYCVAIV
jgi:hypothetical protein